MWDAVTGREALTLKGPTDPDFGWVAFSPDGRRITSDFRHVKVWDVSTGRQILALENSGIVAFSPDGRRIASTGHDSKVRVWDASTGREILVFTGHTSRADCIAFSRDGRRIASAGPDSLTSPRTRASTLRVWDASTGQELLMLKGHIDGLAWVAFSPDGRRIASAGRDSTLRLWDASTGRETVVLKGHRFGLSDGAFSPDGRRLAVSGPDFMKVWDAATGREVLALQEFSKRVEFSPDGRWLVFDRSRVLEAETGKEVFPFDLHSGHISGVAFSPDGRRLATSSWDRTVKLWDTATGQETLTLRGHPDRVESVVFSPDAPGSPPAVPTGR